MNMRGIILLAVSHFNNAKEVESYLLHVFRLELPGQWSLEVVIADNSGNLNLSEGVAGKATVYHPGENLGYLRGCSYAIDRWVAEHGRCPDWLGVTNTDIEFSADFFPRLISLSLPDEVCCAAPDIFLPDGGRQNPHMRGRPSRLEMYSYTLIYRSPLVTALMDRLNSALLRVRSLLESNLADLVSKGSEGTSPETIYAPHGSCVMFRRNFFEWGGGMAFKGFMYGEEIFIGEEARIRNLKIVWVPGLKVVHFKKATTGKVLQAEKVRWRLEVSRILWDDYFSTKR